MPPDVDCAARVAKLSGKLRQPWHAAFEASPAALSASQGVVAGRVESSRAASVVDSELSVPRRADVNDLAGILEEVGRLSIESRHADAPVGKAGHGHE